MKTITARVARFDPAVDQEPYFETYTVQVNEGARVLHVLHAIRDEHDPTLSYRYCCGSGQCGSCAVRVDGTPVLACMEEARDGITIEPLALPVQKDLVVDMEPVLRKIAWISSGEGAALPDRKEIEAIKPLRNCIECLSCVSACPALQVSEFAGPTILRQQMRLALDPRDTKDRIDEAIEQGLFFCTTCKRCVEVCPKDIDIPGKAIEKLREVANRRGLTLPRHQEVAKMVEETGRSVARTQPTFLEQVPEVIEPDGEVRGEVGFFVGCMFNGRVPQTALDAMEVMKRNGIRVIVPHDQVCCGSPLLRTGQTAFLDDPETEEHRRIRPPGYYDGDDHLRRVRGDTEERLRDTFCREGHLRGAHRVRHRAAGEARYHRHLPRPLPPATGAGNTAKSPGNSFDRSSGSSWRCRRNAAGPVAASAPAFRRKRRHSGRSGTKRSERPVPTSSPPSVPSASFISPTAPTCR